MSHTEGKLTYRKNPWDEGKYDLLGEEKNSSGYAPLAHVKGDKRITGGNGEANARRLVACWNACDGLPQDALDGGWTAAGVSQYAKRLEDENAALKAENERLRKPLLPPWAPDYGSGPVTPDRIYQYFSDGAWHDFKKMDIGFYIADNVPIRELFTRPAPPETATKETK